MGSSPQHHPAYIRLCERLLTLRQSAELTQRGLAAKLGKPHSYVAKVEHGDRRIDPVEFKLWCNACSADAADELRRLRV